MGGEVLTKSASHASPRMPFVTWFTILAISGSQMRVHVRKALGNAGILVCDSDVASLATGAGFKVRVASFYEPILLGDFTATAVPALDGIRRSPIALYDGLRNSGAIEQSLAVNFLGPLNVTLAFLPLLKRSKGAIINNVSLVALAPLPVVPAYSISKAALFNMTQSLRALLAGRGVTVHAVVLGPVDTDMNRGFEIPKASTESAAQGIFDGLEKGHEIFPEPASLSIAEGWRTGAAKALERQFAAFVPGSPAKAA